MVVVSFLLAALAVPVSLGLRGATAQQATPTPIKTISPTQTNAPVSETLEAAKLAAFASGNVVAGPGQVVIPAGLSGENTLWTSFGDQRVNWTLTAQGFGGCRVRFNVDIVVRRSGRTTIVTQFLAIGPFHNSFGLTERQIVAIRYEPVDPLTSDCPFLWVLRST